MSEFPTEVQDAAEEKPTTARKAARKTAASAAKKTPAAKSRTKTAKPPAKKKSPKADASATGENGDPKPAKAPAARKTAGKAAAGSRAVTRKKAAPVSAAETDAAPSEMAPAVRESAAPDVAPRVESVAEISTPPPSAEASAAAAPPPVQADGAAAAPQHQPRPQQHPHHQQHGGAPPPGAGAPHSGGPPPFQKKKPWWKEKRDREREMRQLRQQQQMQARGGQPPQPGQPNNGAPGQAQAHHHPQRPPFQPRPEPVMGPPEQAAGLLEISGKGFGFIRLREKNYAQSPTDTFVTPEMVRKYGLRDGVWLEGEFRRGYRGPQMTELRSVNGRSPDQYRQLPMFEELTAINPNKRYVLETEGRMHTTRLVDMISPIGRGQRGLIVAAPRAGKTTFLEHIAQGMLKNYPNIKVIVLLVDERPEEVTELTRALPGAELMASSNDQDGRAHIRMAHLAVERAKRLVEAGEHVFMLLDSITRLARAFNQVIRGGGKAMSGGIDSRALEMPRKIFAAARNTREAGSLTIVATALIETNNKGDDLIFQEFKGTGNMELVLDRRIAQHYIYPAVDIFKSGTRREELLLPPYQLEKINIIRRGLAGHKPVEAVERLLHFLERFNNNAELLTSIGTPRG
jgi:transcription termination factor Rho